MFDVSWSMEQETVRSHRKKKASNPKLPTPTKPPNRMSLMSSASSGSSMKAPSTSSRGMSTLGLFRRDKKQSRKGKEVDRGDAASIASSQPSTTATTTTEGSEERDSEDEDGEPRGRVQGRTSYPRDGTVIDDSCQSSILSSADSISSAFSPWSTASSAYSHPLDITAKHEFQHINRHSFVMRTTEVTTTSKDIASLQSPLQEVHISSDVPNHCLDPNSYTETSPPPKSLRNKLTIPSSSRTTLGKIRPNTARLSTPQPLSPVMQNWQPPDNWACPRPGSPISTAPTTATRQVQKSTHLSHQITRMASASAKIMLESLTEWTQVTDADFYKDLMFEKQLWTLTALAFLRRSGEPYVPPEIDLDSDSEGDSRDIRVLSLFESKASFTFNLTFSAPPALPLHHPIPATATLPFPAELFDQITSLPLPTLLPSTDIPRLLRECNRILLPGGTLKLMHLDATPVIGTMGTLLKSWLAKHLCSSLEKRGRLIEVRKRMAIYLLDAGFTGSEGDLKISFRAAEQEFSRPKVPKVDKNGKDKHGNRVSSKDIAKAARELEKAKKEETMHRLSVIVGRLLWKELWGPYVLGHKWWWEDERIVEECRGLGTRWEGVMVEAVKRS